MDEPSEAAAGSLISLVEALIQLAPLPMLVTDERGRPLAANRAWQEMTGRAWRSQPGDDEWLAPLEPEGRKSVADAITRTGSTGTPVTVEVEVAAAGVKRWTRWWLRGRDVAGRSLVVIAAADMSDEIAQARDLRLLATHDDLTGLVNRRFFLETVDQALRRAERFPEPVCVLYIDLDGFKAVNDRAGHAVGDRVLATVAARLRPAVRGADVVARIGGDEFAVLVDRLSSPGEADVVVRRIEEALNGSVEVDGEQWQLSASVGIAISHGDGDSALAMVGRADEAMYRAKRDRLRSSPRPIRPMAGGPWADSPPKEREGSRPGPGPEGEEPATGPYEPDRVAPAGRLPVTERLVVDVRNLRIGMESIRESLEVLLRGIETGRG